MNGFSPEQARAFRRRWELVEERERAEESTSTIEEKLDEVERLMLSLEDFGWHKDLDDDAPVRARWARLRMRMLSAGAAH